jgi:predicted ArsR family transcriptional regulator
MLELFRKKIETGETRAPGKAAAERRVEMINNGCNQSNDVIERAKKRIMDEACTVAEKKEKPKTKAERLKALRAQLTQMAEFDIEEEFSEDE